MRNLRKIGLLAFLLVVLFIAGCSTASAYNRQAAVQYAIEHTEPDANQPTNKQSEYNQAYHAFDSDCTNFISQCLYYGGWKQVGRYNAWSSNSWYYVYYSWPSSLCFGYSRSWTSANDFYKFCTVHPERAQSASLSSLEIGDIVQMDFTGDGKWDHSLIVTKKTGSNIYLSAHSNDLENEPLSAIKSRNPGARYKGWHIK